MIYIKKIIRRLAKEQPQLRIFFSAQGAKNEISYDAKLHLELGSYFVKSLLGTFFFLNFINYSTCDLMFSYNVTTHGFDVAAYLFVA